MTGIFLKRDYESKDKDSVTELVLNLKKYYPTIDKWWEKEIMKIENGEDNCIVACIKEDLKENIVGIGIFGMKPPFSVKLKTFYIDDDWRWTGIGSFLLDSIIDSCIERKVKRIYVTFAEEEVDLLINFFQEYGFLFDGFAPFRYREGISEYIMGKLQVYGEVEVSNFQRFVKEYLFRLRGYKLEKEENNSLCYKKIITAKESYRIYVKIITDRQVDKTELLKIVDEESKKFECTSKYLVTYYPLEIKRPDIKIFDGHDLEIMFHPLKLKRQGYVGIIQPIYPVYCQRILYNGEQMQLDIDKKSLMREKVFFRWPEIYYPNVELKRGSVLVFYETKPTQAIVGEGRVATVEIGESEIMYKKHRGKGVVTLKEVQNFSKEGKIMTIILSKIIRYKNKLYWKSGDINRIVPEYEPKKNIPITQKQLDEIRAIAS